MHVRNLNEKFGGFGLEKLDAKTFGNDEAWRRASNSRSEWNHH